MILERYHPQLILYDVEPSFDINVYAEDRNNKRYISRLKPYYRHKAIGDIIKEVSTEEWYKVHSGMMRYNMSIITMFTEGLRKSKEDIKGFSPMQGVYDREPKQKVVKNELDPFKLKYFEALIALAKSRRIPIVVLASPKYGMTSSCSLQPVIDICQQNGVEFMDYYADKEFMQHKEWFIEPMHLNTEGARHFSAKIAQCLCELLNASD